MTLFNLFKHFPHRHACITIILGLNLLTTFTMLQSKLIIMESRTRNPEAVKMGLFATIVNDHKRYLLSQSAPSQLR